MSIFGYFKNDSQQSSASIAKERLQIIVAHERGKHQKPDYLPKMQMEIIDVIRKYANIDNDDVQISLKNIEDCSVLELNVALPDQK